MADVRLAFDGVWKKFQRGECATSLRDLLPGLLGSLKRSGELQRGEFNSLKDISFEVRAGECLGIVGPNGAGKSTLLKLLAGIYLPASGKRVVQGKISSLFDISLGFEAEASGWENISYRSYLQGETPATVRDKIDAIAEFSELGEFLHMPVRCYSAGMKVRLAFSIATAINPEILLVDEALSAGDLAFQDKARQRIQELMEKAKLIVLVSHDLQSLGKLCDQIAWMDHGQIRRIGDPASTMRAYVEYMQGTAAAAA